MSIMISKIIVVVLSVYARWCHYKSLKGKVHTLSHLQVAFIVQLGVLVKCVEILQDTRCWDRHFQVVSLFSLFAGKSAKLTQLLVEAGAVDALTDLLQRSYSIVTVDAAAQVLGHIARWAPSHISPESCNRIAMSLAASLSPANSADLLVSVPRSLANLFDSYGKLRSETAIRNCTAALVKIMRLYGKEPHAESCRALIHLCQSSKKNLMHAVDQLTESGDVPTLLQDLDSGNANMIEPCLEAMVYFLNSSESRHFVDAGLLPRLANLLSSANRDIVCRAAWTVRNIATPTNGQTLTLVRAGFVPLLVDVVYTGSVDARNHAVYALGCIASEAEDHEPIIALFSAEAIQAMSSMLTCNDTDLIPTLHTIYDTLMNVANYRLRREVALSLIDCGGLELIKNLQNHERDDICRKARAVTNCILDCIPRAHKMSPIVDHCFGSFLQNV